MSWRQLRRFCLAMIVFIYSFIFKFYFILLYNTVLVLPYINMNPPRVYTCSHSWTNPPPPSPYHLSGSSQCTSPEHPVSCKESFLIWYYTCFNAILPYHPTLSGQKGERVSENHQGKRSSSASFSIACRLADSSWSLQVFSCLCCLPAKLLRGLLGIES